MGKDSSGLSSAPSASFHGPSPKPWGKRVPLGPIFCGRHFPQLSLFITLFCRGKALPKQLFGASYTQVQLSQEQAKQKQVCSELLFFFNSVSKIQSIERDISLAGKIRTYLVWEHVGSCDKRLIPTRTKGRRGTAASRGAPITHQRHEAPNPPPPGGVWDALRDAREEHFGIAQDSLWDAQGRKQRWGKGETKVVWGRNKRGRIAG